MSSRRVYLFGIGSPEWQRRTGHVISKLGVPIPVRPRPKPAKRKSSKGRRR